MRNFFRRILGHKVFCSFFLSPNGKRILLALPSKLHFKLLSGFVVPVELPVIIHGQKFSIFSSIQDDHFYNAYKDRMQNWEVEAITAWINSVEQNSTVIDIGAYLGIYSITALKHGAQNVIAYEPNFLTADKLRENLQLNGYLQNTLIREIALSDVQGRSELYVPKSRKLSSGAQLAESEIVRDLSVWETLSTVQKSTLDDDLRQERFERISAIKIDTEGFELQVLLGAAKTLSLFKPAVLVEIFEKNTLREIASFMNNLGYEDPIALDGIDAREFVEEDRNFPKANNYLFLNRK
jgi:FkbM family methyltransferase